MPLVPPGHHHPGPPWSPLPGEPLGIARKVIHMDVMSDLVGSALAQCATCTGIIGREALRFSPQIAALAATLYAPLPAPLPGMPRPVYEIRSLTHRAAASALRDFTPVHDAVLRMPPQSRALVLADMLEHIIAHVASAPPPPVSLLAPGPLALPGDPR